MGTIYTFSGTTTDNATIPTSTWTSSPNKVAKVYINNIYAAWDLNSGSTYKATPRFRMTVNDATILEVAYQVSSTVATQIPDFKATGANLSSGQIGLELKGGCGFAMFDYRTQTATPTGNQLSNLVQASIGNLLNDNVLSGRALIHCIAVDDRGLIYNYMDMRYNVPEYFYLHQGDVLKLRGHTGSANLHLTVVSES